MCFKPVNHEKPEKPEKPEFYEIQPKCTRFLHTSNKNKLDNVFLS